MIPSKTQCSAKRIACVLFDLDGTLLDTAPDLIHALNAVKQWDNETPLPAHQLRPLVSHGSLALLKFAFPQQSTSDLQRRQQYFFTQYAENIKIDTVLFAGMSQVLDELQQRQIPWGIVTNKPSALTHKLLAAMQLDHCVCSVICGDTLAVSKPDPLPLLTAAKECGVEPTRCLYIGDAERDIQAARAAQMPNLLARYGYIAADDDINRWQADHIIDSPLAILDYLV
ncbi:MAG: HAD family hydrolase [bacterium]